MPQKPRWGSAAWAANICRDSSLEETAITTLTGAGMNAVWLTELENTMI